MTAGRVDGATDVGIAEIVVTAEETGEAIGEATAEETGAAVDLSVAHMAVRIADIKAGTRHSGVRNSFPKC